MSGRERPTAKLVRLTRDLKLEDASDPEQWGALDGQLHAIVRAADESLEHLAARQAESESWRAPLAAIGRAADEHLAKPASVLVDADEAAHLLGITRAALFQRVHRRQVQGVVRTGRRVQFHREKLLQSVERKARR